MRRAPFDSHRPPAALLAGVVVLVCTWTQPAFAQHATIEEPAPVTASLAALLASYQPFGRTIEPRVGTVDPIHAVPLEPVSPGRPAALPPLYISFAVLQGLDAHSTMTAVSAGGREINPAVKGLLTQPSSFVAAKIAATAGTVYLTERLWKKHRVAAVALMVAVNAMYGAIVARNYRGGR